MKLATCHNYDLLAQDLPGLLDGLAVASSTGLVLLKARKSGVLPWRTTLVSQAGRSSHHDTIWHMGSVSIPENQSPQLPKSC